jgi:hypothetical protein
VTKVYIASPYRLGDKMFNVFRQISAADKLISLGFSPYVPLLNHFQDVIFPQGEKTWINLDNDWLPVCDCVLRLQGKSKGADAEVRLAKRLKIPVYYSIAELRRGEA